MPAPVTPSPKRKLRAGLVIAGIVILVTFVTFVGMNIDYALEDEESPISDTELPG